MTGKAKPQRTDAKPIDPLVGKRFLSRKDGEGGVRVLGYQGEVIGRVRYLYLVQLFSYLDGGPTDQKLMSLDELRDATFYDSDEAWRDACTRELERERAASDRTRHAKATGQDDFGAAMKQVGQELGLPTRAPGGKG